LKDGTIDIIATDHAPHEAAAKAKPMEEAPFGVIGLETAFAVSYTKLVRGGALTLPQLADKMSSGPARLIGLDRGSISAGKVADLTLVDLDVSYAIDSADFASKGSNTPFEGREVYGRVLTTMRNGTITYEAHSAL
jgi:dihydroorotase